MEEGEDKVRRSVCLEQLDPLGRDPQLGQVLALVVLLFAGDAGDLALAPALLALLELGRRDGQADEDGELERAPVALERGDRLFGPERGGRG